MTKRISTLLVVTLTLAGCPADSARDPVQGDAGMLDATATPAADGGTGTSDGAAPDGGMANLTQANLDKFMSCSVYEPSLGPSAYSVEDAYDACIAGCVVTSSCADLKASLCWEEELPENAFTRCLERCDDTPADGFRCGDGSRIPHAYRCDFEPDCPDEADEANCGQFRCADGEVLPASSARCDYIEDCDDGSDETGCALTCP
jgi:hypothetical protein